MGGAGCSVSGIDDDDGGTRGAQSQVVAKTVGFNVGVGDECNSDENGGGSGGGSNGSSGGGAVSTSFDSPTSTPWHTSSSHAFDMRLDGNMSTRLNQT